MSGGDAKRDPKRPGAAPTVIATLTEGAPGRLVRKLDKQPELAEAWQWQGPEGDRWTVTTDRGETVTLTAPDGRVTTPDQVACTCLLSPRCLHCLAVVTALPLADPSNAAAAVGVNGDGPADVDGEVEVDGEAKLADVAAATAVTLSADQRAAARAAWTTGAQLLHLGARAAGTLAQAELLRVIHTCRAARLHRLGATGVRLLQDIRALRAGHAEFTLAQLVADHHELLRVAHRLSPDDADDDPNLPTDVQWLGTARRAYETVGSLRLFGLFSEPIATASGYAGVVTYLCDGDGRLFTLSDVLPGTVDRVRGAYRGDVSVGDAHASHQALARRGLFLQQATASADGRLGSGRQVRAVISDPTRWTQDGPDSLWKQGLAAQLQRAYGALALPLVQRPAGSDLLFADAVVLGGGPEALQLVLMDPAFEQDLQVASVPASEHEQLTYRKALELLGGVLGLRVRLVARVRFDRPRTVELLALGTPPPPEADDPASDPSASEEPGLRLPDDWHGRVCVGLDELRGAYLGAHLAPSAAPAALAGLGDLEHEAPLPDPFDALRRHLWRVCLGGRAALEPAVSTLAREAQRLEAQLLPTASALLCHLAQAAAQADRDLTGRRQRAHHDGLAQAWLWATEYEQTATRALLQDLWTLSP